MKTFNQTEITFFNLMQAVCDFKIEQFKIDCTKDSVIWSLTAVKDKRLSEYVKIILFRKVNGGFKIYDRDVENYTDTVFNLGEFANRLSNTQIIKTAL